MITRTSSATVTFQRPFILDGFDQTQPAGSYVIDTDEEQIDSLLVNAWRRIRTTIRLPQPGGIVEYLSVDPDALREALMRDGAQEDSDDVAKRRHDRARGTPKHSARPALQRKK